MRLPQIRPSLLVLAAVAALGAAGGVRSLFLNGVDISSARSQDLKNVDVHINENGDVFILAPHYQVNEEDTYVPLSKYVQGLNLPVHKAPQAAGESHKVGVATKQDTALAPKAGEPMSPPVPLKKEPTAKAEDPPPALPGDEPEKPASDKPEGDEK